MFLDPDDIINKEVYESLKEVAICDICTGIVWEPKQCTSCENTFCINCITAWNKKSKSCPFKCEDFVVKDPTRIIRNMLSKLQFKCPLAQCEKNVAYEEMGTHEETCKPAEIVDCPICGSKDVEKEKIDEYKKKVCNSSSNNNSTSFNENVLKSKINDLEGEISKLKLSNNNSNSNNSNNSYELEKFKRDNTKLQDEIKSLQLIVSSLGNENNSNINNNNSSNNNMNSRSSFNINSNNNSNSQFKSMKTSGIYSYSGDMAGSDNVHDLGRSTSLTEKYGVCSTTPGMIEIELSREMLVDSIDLGGYGGNKKLWYPENGYGAKILAGYKGVYVEVGKIPSGYGTIVKKVTFNSQKMTHIKFTHNSYLGLGYLKLNESNRRSSGIMNVSSFNNNNNNNSMYKSLETSGIYSFKGQTAGSNNVLDLLDGNPKTGICSKIPGKIIIEFFNTLSYDSVKVCGWDGNSSLWAPSNGSKAKIYSSNDNSSWTKIGDLPSLSKTIQTVSLTRTKSKYIKIESTGYLGLGVFEINGEVSNDSYFNNNQSSYSSYSNNNSSVYAVNFTSSKVYRNDVGTHNVKDLSDRSLGNGICTAAPSWITCELNKESYISTIELGGFNGNPKLWHPTQGVNADIHTSKDNVTWSHVGNIPKTHGANIISFKVSGSQAKYVRFSTKGYLGIGYFKCS